MFKMTAKHAAALATAGFLALGTALPAAAQSQGSYSEQKLQAYASAHIQVAELVSEYRPALESAQQAGEAKKVESLQQEANKELIGLIEDANNISIDEYREITAAARQDQELFQRLQSMVTQMQQ